MRREPYTRQSKNLTGNGGVVNMVACSRLVMMLTLFFDKGKPFETKASPLPACTSCLIFFSFSVAADFEKSTPPAI
jgi:hypothetical protein